MAIGKPLISESQWDDATITASESSASFPVTNLLRNGRAHLWSSLDTVGTKTLKLDAGDLRTVSLVVLFHHNGTLAGTFRVRLATTEANLTASPLHDTGTFSTWATTDMDVLTWKNAYVHVSPSVSARWIQVDISDEANPDGFFRMGRVLVANALQTGFFSLVGSDFATGRDFSILEQTPLGFDYAVVQDPRPAVSRLWSTELVSEAERLWRAWLLSGLTRDVAVVGTPGATTIADLSLGIFRFEQEPKIRWEARMSETEGYLTANLKLRGI